MLSEAARLAAAVGFSEVDRDPFNRCDCDLACRSSQREAHPDAVVPERTASRTNGLALVQVCWEQPQAPTTPVPQPRIPHNSATPGCPGRSRRRSSLFRRSSRSARAPRRWGSRFRPVPEPSVLDRSDRGSLDLVEEFQEPSHVGTTTSLPFLGLPSVSSSARAWMASSSRTVRATGTCKSPRPAASATAWRSEVIGRPEKSE